MKIYGNKKSFSLRSGFTLIELLVVISIIAVLMSIMMPALRKARNQARRTVCGSNLNQIGVALNMYTNEHNSRLPEIYSNQFFQYWFYQGWATVGADAPKRFLNLGVLAGEGLLDHQGDIFFCPANRDKDGNYTNSKGDTTHNNYVGAGSGSPSLAPYHQHLGWTHARAGYFRNLGPLVNRKYRYDNLNVVAGNPLFADIATYMSHIEATHENGINVLYGDGRVEFRILSQELKDLIKGRETPQEDWELFWKGLR